MSLKKWVFTCISALSLLLVTACETDNNTELLVEENLKEVETVYIEEKKEVNNILDTKQFTINDDFKISPNNDFIATLFDDNLYIFDTFRRDFEHISENVTKYMWYQDELYFLKSDNTHNQNIPLYSVNKFSNNEVKEIYPYFIFEDNAYSDVIDFDINKEGQVIFGFRTGSFVADYWVTPMLTNIKFENPQFIQVGDLIYSNVSWTGDNSFATYFSGEDIFNPDSLHIAIYENESKKIFEHNILDKLPIDNFVIKKIEMTNDKNLAIVKVNDFTNDYYYIFNLKDGEYQELKDIKDFDVRNNDIIYEVNSDNPYFVIFNLNNESKIEGHHPIIHNDKIYYMNTDNETVSIL